MATNRKQPKMEPKENEICGYLHEVSPIKTSVKNNLYFDGTIQTGRGEYQHFVCFDAAKQSSFSTTVTAMSPVKIKDIQLVPSQRQANVTDVMVKRQSTMEIKKALTFPYKKPKNLESQVTIQECLEMPAYNNVR